jgi:protoheme IX farnesyltransferase
VAAIAASLILSARFLNATTCLLLAAAAAGYAILYTLVWKRRSPYGTIPGAVPGALPVLIGYAAVNPRIGMDGVLLFLILVFWQPPHFWALALRHQAEYRAAGVPVLPVAFGEPYTKVLIFLYAAALLPLSLSLWALGYLSARFGWAAFLLGAGFLAVFYRDTVATRRFGRAFAASIVYLTLLLLALLADVLFR